MHRSLAAMAVVVAAAALVDAHAAAQAPPALTRVRPVDPRARDLLFDAWRASSTVRKLVEALEASDLIVQIEAQKRPARFRGHPPFMTATPGCRYLRVSVRVPDLPEVLLPALAHELQHAVEIARAPDVRDERGVQDLFVRIGWGSNHTVFETSAAIMVEERVRLEVTRPR